MTSETSGTSNVETEYLEINSKEAWPVLYQHTRSNNLLPTSVQQSSLSDWSHIRNECGNYAYTCNESKKPQNRIFNRYRDVAPYDHSRIILKKGPCDYINANLVRMDRAHRQYILTQGPLANTSGHFWLMVWEQNSKAVLMLNKVIEKNLVKCHQYWPLEGSSNHIMMFPDVGLKVEYLSKTDASHYTTRILRLTDVESKESREILHFHYTMWPDFGVPQSPTAFLQFLADVRQSGALDQNVGPPVIHCSAGIGRSGTFCLVDSCLVLIEENGLNSVNVRDVLLEMRRYRMGLIQTPDQLRFSYEAIIEGAKQLPSNNVNINTNEVRNNSYNPVEAICNSLLEEVEEDDEEDEEDDTPPQPPPRGESLMKSEWIPSPTSDNDISSPPDKPLPCEPPSYTEPSTSPPPANPALVANNLHDQNSDNVALPGELHNDGENSFKASSPPSSPDTKNELRQRNLAKKEKLAAQVREMKRRQKETEEWQQLKRSLFKPLSIGIGAAIVGGGVIAFCGYLYLRG
ncbi:tyrosine-protein phosphatase non-receptor type 2 isoform X3 [Neodiprion pinetum]|uniref:tyrosine-protein phosphatase non-receptor type 2 isoform X3 n=1 Tax=Neodiprion pinetum TaxID=441929 RepID=UPI001EDD28D9|nr:tyrosine-protein phosphatase non-receptor type 2 isoform X3 [Neodiprion pinetum]